MNGRTKMYENIVKGDWTSSPGIPESFNVLVQELRGLAVNVTVWDGKGKKITLTEKEDELLNRVDNFQA